MKYRDLLNDQLMVCTTCGAVVEDESLHTKFHQFTGRPVDLSGLGGANDVPPLPERGR